VVGDDQEIRSGRDRRAFWPVEVATSSPAGETIGRLGLEHVPERPGIE
jgi:hypothetical protein